MRFIESLLLPWTTRRAGAPRTSSRRRERYPGLSGMRLRCSEGDAARSSTTRLARSSNATRNGRARKRGSPPLDEPPVVAAAALAPRGADSGAGDRGTGVRHRGAGLACVRLSEDFDELALVPIDDDRAAAPSGPETSRGTMPGPHTPRRRSAIAPRRTRPGPASHVAPAPPSPGTTGSSTGPSTSDSAGPKTTSETSPSSTGEDGAETNGERTAGSDGRPGREAIAGSDGMPGNATGPTDDGGEGEASGAWPSGELRPELTPIAMFDWVTGPSFPGLEIRIATFRFIG